MPRTAKADPAAKGIFLRKKSYWLRYSHNRQQLRVPLHTRDFIAAIAKAKEIRGTAKEDIKPKIKPGERPTWLAARGAYKVDKLAGKKNGAKCRKFRPGTAERTDGIIKVFGEWTKTRSPFDVTTAKLQEYYDFRKKRSVASARTIVDRVCCFLAHIGHVIAKPEYDEEDEKEIRDVVVPPATYSKMIAECRVYSLRFVLYCGFHCGMRRAEIVHARPAWIDIDAAIPVIKIPGRETQRLANGTNYQWRTKNGKPRTIPLGSEFTAWLRENLDQDALFCVRPKNCSKRYRYDPRSAFESYVEKYELKGVSMHSMRHTYISGLCNSGNPSITILKVSAWSGDKIETIERHYWHRNVDSEGLDATLAGERKSDPVEKLSAKMDVQMRDLADQMARVMELVGVGKVTTSEAEKNFALAAEGDPSGLADIIARYGWIPGRFGGDPPQPSRAKISKRPRR